MKTVLSGSVAVERRGLKPTIKDIAKLARVSKGTVSRVISGSESVSKKARDAVLYAVSALHYRPNGVAHTSRISQK